jgi:hypothetical protein
MVGLVLSLYLAMVGLVLSLYLAMVGLVLCGSILLWPSSFPVALFCGSWLDLYSNVRMLICIYMYITRARELRRFELIDIELNNEGGIRAVGDEASIWLGWVRLF